MNTDILQTWGIKNVPKRTIELVNEAAKREGLTNAQWLERRVNEWVDAGSPVRLNPVLPSADYVAAMAAFNRSVVELAAAPDSPLIRTARRTAKTFLLVDRPRLAAPPREPSEPE